MGISRAARLHLSRSRGFTLIEMLVAITVLLIVMVVLFSLTTGVGNVWKSSGGKVSAFQNARYAFSTLTATLSRATLNTYSDYVNVTGAVTTFRNNTNASTFVPTKFVRASELQFVSGSTYDIATAGETSSGTSAININADRDANPGDAVFFQAPLGNTKMPTSYSTLNRALNSVGFYVQYGKIDPSLLPSWLSGVQATKNYRFRLVEFVEPTENLQIYTSTSNPSYRLDWLNFAAPTPTQRARVLAEDIVLLVLRPRLSPGDEAKVAPSLGNATYNEATQLGSVLCPNYHYDSRAWQTGYPSGLRVNDPNAAAGPARAAFMSNQLPPVVDVAMISVDAQSMARFDNTTSKPPAPFQVSQFSPKIFQNSANLEADLTTYATQLSNMHVRFHILRSAIEIQGAKWSNN